VKIVVDTNVLVTGIFFTGPPFRILQAWRDGRVTIVLCPEILAEYRRIGELLAGQFPVIDLAAFLELLTINSEIVSAQPLPKSVCADPDDDMFLGCALAAKAKIIVSGDKHLLKVEKYHGIEILTPRRFVDTFLS
jgi:putative PIN family toxin of toxin-antitoxin system